MKVLLFEDNLFWSARLQKTLYALGHDCEVLSSVPVTDCGANVALVSLSLKSVSPSELVPALKRLGLYVVGFAGHKETELREIGLCSGCDRIATNSEVTFRLGALLQEPGGRKE